MKKIVLAVLSLELIALGAVRAQAPTGAVIPSACVVVTNKEIGVKRALATGAGGDYSAPALLAGVYEVTAEAPGFQPLVRGAIIEARSNRCPEPCVVFPRVLADAILRVVVSFALTGSCVWYRKSKGEADLARFPGAKYRYSLPYRRSGAEALRNLATKTRRRL